MLPIFTFSNYYPIFKVSIYFIKSYLCEYSYINISLNNFDILTESFKFIISNNTLSALSNLCNTNDTFLNSFKQKFRIFIDIFNFYLKNILITLFYKSLLEFLRTVLSFLLILLILFINSDRLRFEYICYLMYSVKRTLVYILVSISNIYI